MIFNNDWFIEKSKLVHGDKYDYSLVDYKNLRTKVKIICSEHGEFEQMPDKHLMKRGCPYCGGTKKLTTNMFIEKASIVHNNYYDYSLVDYKISHVEIKIKCPKHGEFQQLPYVHLSGCGCKKCASNINNFIENANKAHNNKYDYSLTDYKNTYTRVKIICKKHGEFEQFPQSHIDAGCVLCSREENFIQESKIRHDDKYDYSLVNYKDKNTKVKIICSTHGEFEQLPVYHISGNGCKKCADDAKKLNTDIFIEKAAIIHGDKYDYSLVNYIGAYEKVKIICPIHGEFEQRACDHINNNRGCDNCGGTIKSNTEDFIIKSILIHRDKYDYSLVDYNLCTEKVKIICKKHGEFKVSPTNHLTGKGCPICNQSKGENIITNFLLDSNIKYIPQKKFNECKNKLCLPFDFYLLDYNTCIEYDGIQHFKSNIHFGGEEGFKIRKNNDKIKTEFCKNKNINLLRIKYDENIIEKLEKNIK